MLQIYSDGSCFPNPGKGACASIVLNGDNELKRIVYTEPEETTNNRMELMGVINALEEIEQNDLEVITDSMYVIFGIRSNGYSNREEKPNKDLWERYIKALNGRNIIGKHVKAHCGNKYNMLCDMLASIAVGIYKNKEEWWKAERLYQTENL